jgi:hypothetical protein
MTILALILSCTAPFLLLSILWVRVTARDHAKTRHRKVTSHLDWRAPASVKRRSRGNLRMKARA